MWTPCIKQLQQSCWFKAGPKTSTRIGRYFVMWRQCILCHKLWPLEQKFLRVERKIEKKKKKWIWDVEASLDRCPNTKLTQGCRTVKVILSYFPLSVIYSWFSLPIRCLRAWPLAYKAQGRSCFHGLHCWHCIMKEKGQSGVEREITRACQSDRQSSFVPLQLFYESLKAIICQGISLFQTLVR